MLPPSDPLPGLWSSSLPQSTTISSFHLQSSSTYSIAALFLSLGLIISHGFFHYPKPIPAQIPGTSSDEWSIDLNYCDERDGSLTLECAGSTNPCHEQRWGLASAQIDCFELTKRNSMKYNAYIESNRRKITNCKILLTVAKIWLFTINHLYGWFKTTILSLFASVGNQNFSQTKRG